MEKYIPLNALISEIERRKKEEVNYDENGGFASWADHNHYSTLDSIQDFLNTLEVKEVNLEKEYEDYVVDDPIFGNFITNDTMGMNLAKHFFELGLKTQN